jgi:hypothetical protein
MEFYFPDPFATLPLAEIYPISTRARSWLARASRLKEFSHALSVQIAGGVFMLSALDYHHCQFTVRVNQLAPYYERMNAFLGRTAHQLQASAASRPITTETERGHLDALDHEAVAYINRLGQFFYFAKSIKLEVLLPRARELQAFRHKHTAHRSVDNPRDESPEAREMQAMAFNFSRITTGSFPVYEINDKDQHVTFHMRDAHPFIMNEAIQLFQSLHAVL